MGPVDPSLPIAGFEESSCRRAKASGLQEVIGERIVCYPGKEVSERVVPYTGSHRAMETVIEGRGIIPARCTVIKPWAVS